jgi:hypothetical protein
LSTKGKRRESKGLLIESETMENKGKDIGSYESVCVDSSYPPALVNPVKVDFSGEDVDMY